MPQRDPLTDPFPRPDHTIKFTDCAHSVQPEMIPKPLLPAFPDLLEVPGLCLTCDYHARRRKEATLLQYFNPKINGQHDRIARIEAKRHTSDWKIGYDEFLPTARLRLVTWIDQRDGMQETLWKNWSDTWGGRVWFNCGRERDGKATVYRA